MARLLPFLVLLVQLASAIPLNALHEGHDSTTVAAGVPVLQPTDDLITLPDATRLPELQPIDEETSTSISSSTIIEIPEPTTSDCTTTTTTPIETPTTTPCTTTTATTTASEQQDDIQPETTVRVTVTVILPAPEEETPTPTTTTPEPVFVTVTVTHTPTVVTPAPTETPGEFDLIDLDELDELLEEGVLPPVTTVAPRPGFDNDDEEDEDAGIVVSTNTSTDLITTATATATTTTTAVVVEETPQPPSLYSPDGTTLDGDRLEEYWQSRPAAGGEGGVGVEVGCEGCLVGGDGILESEGGAAAAARLVGGMGMAAVVGVVGLVGLVMV